MFSILLITVIADASGLRFYILFYGVLSSEQNLFAVSLLLTQKSERHVRP